LPSRARLTAALAILFAASATLHARPEPVFRVAPPAVTAVPEFRLGTAAKPFGWSTAVGDFNADGRPDVIVADRASQWTRGTGIRLSFSISGEAASIDTLQTTEDGIGIRVADVDHDSDLDIVLSSTISGRTIGVWLNDGAGHFTRSSVRLPGPSTLASRTLDQGLPDGFLLTGDLPSRRGVELLTVRARAPAPSSASVSLSVTARSFASRLASSSAGPRAPPSTLSPIRS
jgi:hypothetical protein